MKATDILEKAAQHMRDRAATYDKPEGERSMGKTVAAFNAITGRNLTTAEGWLMLAVLKQVRVFQAPEKAHVDSLEDGPAYLALMAEEMLSAEPVKSADEKPALKVGQVWKDRAGNEIELDWNTGPDWTNTHPFRQKGGTATYTKDGIYSADGVSKDHRNLVELIRDVA